MLRPTPIRACIHPVWRVAHQHLVASSTTAGAPITTTTPTFLSKPCMSWLSRRLRGALAYEAAIVGSDNATERDFLERRRQALTRA